MIEVRTKHVFIAAPSSNGGIAPIELLVACRQNPKHVGYKGVVLILSVLPARRAFCQYLIVSFFGTFYFFLN